MDPVLQAAILSAAELNKWPWYLYGPAGRGKTCAAACVYRQWPYNFACWWDAGFITRELVTARVEGWAGKITRTVTDAALIALDDIALREPTAAQLDALLGILNARGNRPLIITGNLAPADLANVLKDDRAASRICAGTIIHVVGNDRRLEGATLFEA